MNEELLEFYSNVFIAARAEERYSPFIKMLYNMLEIGYGERYLTKIYNLEIDDACSVVGVLEKYVIDCVYTELQRMGITIDETYAFNHPNAASYFLDFILDGVENCEDPDGLLQILSGEQQTSEKLDVAVKHVYDVPEFVEFNELFLRVSDRFITILTNNLEVIISDNEEAMDADDEEELPFKRRLALYIKRFPQNPEAVLFYNLDSKSPVEPLYDVLSYGHDEYTDLELCVIYTTGIAVMLSKTYDEAYGMAHTIMERIQPDEDLNPFKVLGDVNVALRDIYSSYAELYEGVSDEEDTIH